MKINNQPKRTPLNVLDNHNNGITEFEIGQPYEKVFFKDSDEIATYLQQNCLIKSQEKSHPSSSSFKKQNLNLSHLSISKTYSTMLAQALQHEDFSNLNSLNLTGNNLSGHSLTLISTHLPLHIRKIDLSSNFLTSLDVGAICNILNNKKYDSLIALNLSHN